MSQLPTHPHQPANPLVIPLIAVSVIAVLEGVLLAILLLRDRPAAPAATVTLPPTHASRIAAGSPAPVAPPAATAPAPTAPAATASVPRGKLGQRVESAGFGITVEKVLSEPATYKQLINLNPDQRYLALLILVENNTGRNAGLYPSTFRLQDDQGFEYEQLGIHGTMPVLEWRTMGNRESVRGYIDYVIPKSAKGLTLIYSDVSREGAQPIHVELGQ